MVNMAEEQNEEVFTPMVPRSHHNWGYGRRKLESSHVPSLRELEEMAHRTVLLMEKHGTRSENSYQQAMDLLRLQYNMNFVIICKKCNGHHKIDELLAPER